METFALAATIYALFAIPAVVGALLAWLLLRRRIQLLLTDGLLLVAPFAVWLGATLIHSSGKSLSNILEALLLGGVTALAFGVRAGLAATFPQSRSRFSVAALVVSCVCALALWALVPGLPE